MRREGVSLTEVSQSRQLSMMHRVLLLRDNDSIKSASSRLVTRVFPLVDPSKKRGELNRVNEATLRFVCSIFRTVLTGLSDAANRVLLLG